MTVVWRCLRVTTIISSVSHNRQVNLFYQDFPNDNQIAIFPFNRDAQEKSSSLSNFNFNAYHTYYLVGATHLNYKIKHIKLELEEKESLLFYDR
jgi:hypothetical protein